MASVPAGVPQAPAKDKARPLDSNRHTDVKRILQDAIALPADQRIEFVKRECGDDQRLFEQVRRLLKGTGPDTSLARAAINQLIEADKLDTIIDGDVGRLSAPADGAPDRYRVEGKIGQGGMGLVYRAKDLSLDRDVAIKFLPAEWASDPALMKRFRDEARTVAALNHPNIVVIHSIDEINSVPFMVMELVDGQTLRELLPSSGFPLRQLLGYAIPVADALAAAHAHGITHRDLKPENVMVTHDGRVKVLDFGIAERRLTVTDAGNTGSKGSEAVAGTPSYMSPEQLQGRDTDPRSDVFTFGIMLYELFEGERPFYGETAKELVTAIISADPPPVSKQPDVPRSFGAIVSRCLGKNPAARPKTMAAVLDELVALRREIETDAVRGFVAGTTVDPGEPLRPSGSADQPRAVAVLPFQDLSPDDDHRFICTGIAEEIAAELSRVPELRVSIASRIDRESVDPLELGRMLGVTVVVDGSVKSSGEKLRISIRLVRVSDGTLLWSSRLERPIVDTFAVQDEVAQVVAKTFDSRLAPRSRRSRSENPAAYAAYLRGRYFWERRYEDGLKRALECFSEALAIDGDFAEAHAGMADCFVILGHYGYMETAEAYKRARAGAQKALAILPDLAEAHATMGWIHAFYDWQWDDAENSFRRACELDPNYATAWEWNGIHLLSRGRNEEALASIKNAQRLDPLSLMIGAIFAWANYEVGRSDEGDRILGAVTRTDPHFVFARNVQGGIMASSGKANEAVQVLERTAAVSGREGLTLSFLGYAYGRAGRSDDANRVIRELTSMASQQYVPPFHLALPHIGAGNVEEGLDYLAKAVAQRNSFFASTHFSMMYDTVRQEPRFRTFLNEMGLG